MLPNPGGMVTGAITVGALLAAERAYAENYLETVAAVAVALLVHLLVHTYSGFTEERLKEGQPLEFAALGRRFVHELAIFVGASVPLVVLLGCWVSGVSLGNGVTAAVWTTAGLIVAVEVIAAVRAKLSGLELVVQIGLGVVIGLLVIVIKAILH